MNAAFEVETAYRHEVDWEELKANGINNYQLRWDDSMTQPIYPSQELDEAVDFLHRLVTQGDTVLVSCSMGKSRSTSVLIAYLIACKGVSYDEALRICKQSRPVAKPNANFERQLRQLEKDVQQKLSEVRAPYAHPRAKLGSLISNRRMI
eukprot:NODE_5679_length_626_cov_2.845691_g5515_i0.p1 GENE.NODE_5679_length_626_cov_2.845691_g5515_i0~~NODE_5679_length_626_cov_2.845691_g5515_i0.p1  ORF type:complete len:150 (-),score=19.78 NODE_5679_length_626_cov_2.845691_g5515_i0:50-499(-)